MCCFIIFGKTSLTIQKIKNWTFSIKSILFAFKREAENHLLFHFIPQFLCHLWCPLFIIPLTNVNWLKQYKT